MKIEAQLLEAAKEGDLGGVRMLLMTGLEADVRDDEGWTPLMFAVLRGHLHVIELLIERQADVNAKSTGGFAGTTPLMIAASCGHLRTARTLLDHGAEVDAEGPLGGTALAFAAFQEHPELVRLLVERGAAVDAGNIYGRLDPKGLLTSWA